MVNKGWLEEGQLLARRRQAQGHSRRHRPGPLRLLHAAQDRLGPAQQAWPEAELNIVPDGGHLFSEPGVLDGLIRATDKFAGR